MPFVFLFLLLSSFAFAKEECVLEWKGVVIQNEIRLAGRGTTPLWDDEPFKRIWSNLEDTAARSDGSFRLHPFTGTYGTGLGHNSLANTLPVSGKRAHDSLEILLQNSAAAKTAEEKLELLTQMRRALGNSGVPHYASEAKKAVDDAMSVVNDATRNEDIFRMGYSKTPVSSKGTFFCNPLREKMTAEEVYNIEQVVFDFGDVNRGKALSGSEGGLIPVTFQRGTKGGNVSVKVFALTDQINQMQKIAAEEFPLAEAVKKLEREREWLLGQGRSAQDVNQKLGAAQKELTEYQKKVSIVKNRITEELLEQGVERLKDLSKHVDSQNAAIEKLNKMLKTMEDNVKAGDVNIERDLKTIREILNPAQYDKKAPRLEIDPAPYNGRNR